MFRSLFLALGTYSCLLGLEALAVERAVLKKPAGDAAAVQRVVVPPDWAPWSLMSTGAVVMLYSFTLPKKLKA